MPSLISVFVFSVTVLFNSPDLATQTFSKDFPTLKECNNERKDFLTKAQESNGFDGQILGATVPECEKRTVAYPEQDPVVNKTNT